MPYGVGAAATPQGAPIHWYFHTLPVEPKLPKTTPDRAAVSRSTMTPCRLGGLRQDSRQRRREGRKWSEGLRRGGATKRRLGRRNLDLTGAPPARLLAGRRSGLSDCLVLFPFCGCSGCPPALTTGSLSRGHLTRSLFYRNNAIRLGLSKAPLVEVLNENWKRGLPRLLVVVGQVPELPRVHSQLARHLNVCVGEVKSPAGLDPVLKCRGYPVLALGHRSVRP